MVYIFRPPAPQVSKNEVEHRDDLYIDDEEDYLDDSNDDDSYEEEAGNGHQFNIPDSQLIQEWPYGNEVNVEGKSTVTYSPSSRPAIAPQSGFFSTPPRGASPLPHALFPHNLAAAAAAQQQHPMPGPGYFSSPSRAGQVQPPRYPAPAAAAQMAFGAAAGVPITLGQGLGGPITAMGQPNAMGGPAPNMMMPPNQVISKTGFGSPSSMGSALTAAVGGATGVPFSIGSPVVSQTATIRAPTTLEGTPFKMAMPPATPPTAQTAAAGETSLTTKPAAATASPLPILKLSPSFGAKPALPAAAKKDNDSGAEDDADDSYQEPEFVPIASLPEEVELLTGEEGEQVLFQNRAKLFRFSEKQWKERGLGDIKILQDKESSKFRLLMRREQIFKVCANHLVTPDLQLRKMPDGDDRVWAWSAMDFTEDEGKVEQFSIKFKTADIAAEFHDKIEEAKVALKEKKPTPVKADGSSAKAAAAAAAQGDKPLSLAAQFKPKEGSWECDTCYVRNPDTTKKCLACQTVKPGCEAEVASSPDKLSSSTAQKFTMSSCSGGGFSFGVQPAQPASSTQSSFSFGSPAGGVASTTPVQSGFSFGGQLGGPASTTGQSGFSFGSQPMGDSSATSKSGFSIGNSSGGVMSSTGQSGFSFASQSGASSTAASPTTASSGFSFGQSGGVSSTTGQSGFSFGTPEPKPPSAASQSGLSFGSQSADVSSSTSQSGGSSGSQAPVSSTSKEPSGFSLKSGGFTFGSSGSQSASITSTSSQSEASKSTSTPAADYLASLAAKSKETDSQSKNDEADKKTVLGGFTFTSTPKVTSSEDDKPQKDIKAPVKAEASKENEAEAVKPFAGFSFSPVAKKDSAKTTQESGVSSSGIFGTNPASSVSFASLVSSTKPEQDFGANKGEVPDWAKSPAGPVFKSSPIKSPGKDGEGEEPEEYEPEVDFAPVVPLPDLVDVKTGEEEEEKLFGERSKLYRHDNDLKQWKERGVGEIKILKQKDKCRYRILMRREQVLKLCANHAITTAMKLLPMTSSDRAWCWFAQDYSEEEVKTEQLAIKFKTPEQAIVFKDVFEDCQAKLRESEQSEGEKPKSVPEKSSSEKMEKAEGTPSLASQFKPKAGSWECQACYVVNKEEVKKCVACDTAKPGAVETKPAPAAPVTKGADSLAEKFRPKAGSWECQMCYVVNKEGTKKCCACESLKPGETEDAASVTSSSSGFSFGSSGGFKFGSSDSSGFSFGGTLSSEASVAPSSGFTFGATSAAPSTGGFKFGSGDPTSGIGSSTSFSFGTTGTTTPSTTDKSTVLKTPEKPATEFKFGSTDTFSFMGVTPVSAKPLDLSKTPKTPTTPKSPGESEYYQNEDGEDSHIHFEPIVPLPDKVDVKTGEEDEDLLYVHRAKLFRFAAGEWKERGLGDVKILLHKETKKVRILMRREQILKVCLNHVLTSDMQLNPMPKTEGKAWVWHAQDFSDGDHDGTHQQFAIRFKNEKIASEFKDVFEKAIGKETSAQSASSATKEFSFKADPDVASTVKPSGFSFKSPESTSSFSFGDRFKTSPQVSPGAAVFGGSPSPVKGKAGGPVVRSNSQLEALLRGDDIRGELCLTHWHI